MKVFFWKQIELKLQKGAQATFVVILESYIGWDSLSISSLNTEKPSIMVNHMMQNNFMGEEQKNIQRANCLAMFQHCTYLKSFSV